MSVQRLNVTFSDGRAHDVRIGPRIIRNLGIHLDSYISNKRLFVITDDVVGPRYLGALVQALEARLYKVESIVVPAGEAAKSLESAQAVWASLLEKSCDRESTLIALGGGTICDLTGFVAATYMRGISVCLCPTTLLAMVDAAIGGKNALNLPGMRNAIGTIWQPRYVACDTDLLASLPPEQWESGFAEIVKSALLLDDDACIWLADNIDALQAHESDVLQEAIVQTAAFKAQIVTQDERQDNVRASLNFGHTFGHAFEVVSNYEISHGQAVAQGMRLAIRVAQKLFDVQEDFVLAVDDLLDEFGLPWLPQDFDSQALLDVMERDKKNVDGHIRLVLVTSPGEWQLCDVSREDIKSVLDMMTEYKLSAATV